jgi:dTMP kinase
MAGRDQKEIYEYLDFQIKVRDRYLALLPVFREQGIRVEIIDAAPEAEEVATLVWKAIEKMPIFKG